MYILKLKMGMYDEEHEHLSVAISDDIQKLEDIEKEWTKIKSAVYPDYPIEDLLVIVNDFFKKYEVMGQYEECDDTYVKLEQWWRQEIPAVVASMTYISKIKQI